MRNHCNALAFEFVQWQVPCQRYCRLGQAWQAAQEQEQKKPRTGLTFTFHRMSFFHGAKMALFFYLARLAMGKN